MRQSDGQMNSSMEAMLGIQRRSDYSQQSSSQGGLQASCVPQEQPTDEEFEPYLPVRKFRRRQRELSAQLPIPAILPPQTEEQRQRQMDTYRGLMQETPKPQREKRGKYRTFQHSVGNSLAEPLDEISYIPRDSQSNRGPHCPEGNVNQLDLTSYMQLPPVGQDSNICGKCGEQGHVKRQCTANVACDFCKARSHAT